MRQLMDVQDHIHRAFDAARPTFHLFSWIWCKVSVDERRKRGPSKYETEAHRHMRSPSRGNSDR